MPESVLENDDLRSVLVGQYNLPNSEEIIGYLKNDNTYKGESIKTLGGFIKQRLELFNSVLNDQFNYLEKNKIFAEKFPVIDQILLRLKVLELDLKK